MAHKADATSIMRIAAQARSAVDCRLGLWLSKCSMSASPRNTRLFAGKETFAFILILGCAAALYLHDLTYSDIWIDEACSKALTRHPFPEMMRIIAGDFHPPLYFVALKLFTAVIGTTDLTIRLFSVVGALSALGISYVVGRRLLGQAGALFLCLLMLAVPMPGLYSHVARMYTWTVFVSMGVLLYALLYAKEHRRRDLVLLGFFSVMAAYIHYYCLIAAFWTNLAVLLYLFARKDPAWRALAAMGAVVLVLFLPWLSVLLSQTRAVQKDFWIQPVTWSSFLSCYTQPFFGVFFPYALSWVEMAVVYGLKLAGVWSALFSRKTGNRLPLGLSLFVFNAALLTVVAVSLLVKPILYPRYVMTLMPMLLVPPVVALLSWKRNWLAAIPLATALGCGVFIVLSEFKVSYGPYRQSLERLSKAHPEVRKIVHVAELTAGPFAEYGRGGPWTQYYLKNDRSSWYLNMDIFPAMTAVKDPSDVAPKEEVFCLAVFDPVPLNKTNIDLVLARCRTVAREEVADAKPYPGIKITLYLLKYAGR